jgi:hypothetical protein
MRPGLQHVTGCGWLLMACLLAVAADARAQNPLARNETVTFVVAAQAKLTLSATTQTFPNSDPDTVAQILATEGPVTITTKGRTAPGNQIILSVLASNDFQSGVNIIAIGTLTWTGSGSGYVGGTMNKSVAQQVGLWSHSGNFVGTQTYRFANSWTYATGSYGVTLTYTLSAP